MKNNLIRDIETGTVYSLITTKNDLTVCANKITPAKSFVYVRDPETGMAYKVAGTPARQSAPVTPCLLNSILQEQLKISVGCTELSAIAYAVSLAYNTVAGSLPPKFRPADTKIRKVSSKGIKRIILTLDRKVYKNAFAAELPSNKHIHGFEYIAALGVSGNLADELNILKNTTDKNIAFAKRLVNQRKIQVAIYNKTVSSPYIKAELSLSNCTAIVVINHHHSNVTIIKLDGKIIYRAPEQTVENPFSPTMRVLSRLTIKQLIDLAHQLSSADKDYLHNALRINERISRYGLTHYRNNVTGALQDMIKHGLSKNDLSNRAQLETTAAVEARMSGAPIEVMTVAGSGNQGLIAMLPINSVANQVGRNDKRLLEALALSCLVTAYTTSHIGYLSPLCGCFIKSGVGATAGITYYMNGKEKEISSAIKNMIGISAGVICDGAKVGCALKAASATTTAVDSALLGLRGVVIPEDNGIVNHTAEQTIRNLGLLSHSMDKSDRSIVDIMSSKN